jgi:4-aminobutyrate aminotransferase-like enzyme
MKIEDLIHKRVNTGKDVAGIVIEPIQCEGGDHHPSARFMQELQRLSKKVITSFTFFAAIILMRHELGLK